MGPGQFFRMSSLVSGKFSSSTIYTPFDFNFLAFCDTYKLKNKITSNIFLILKNNRIIQIGHKFNQKSTILFTISGKQLFHHQFNSKLSKKLIDFLLRSYGGVFQKEIKRILLKIQIFPRRIKNGF